MPTDSKLKLDEFIYAEVGNEWVKIGNLNKAPIVELTESDCKFNGISLNYIVKGIEGTIEFNLLGEKPTNRKKKLFRENFGIDLLKLRFPKKKNRRMKRRRRKAYK